MSAEALRATKFLFEAIKRIYRNFEIPDELDVDCWIDILRGYSQDSILKALKCYRKTEEFDKAPTPGAFAAYLKGTADRMLIGSPVEVNDHGLPEDDWREVIKTDLAEGLRMRSGSKNLRFWYKKAVDAIFAERVDRLPEARFWDYGRKVKEYFERGFFDDVDEIAENIRQQEVHGKSGTTPMPLSTETSGNWLATHWKAGA